jgi:hypothetical protein
MIDTAGDRSTKFIHEYTLPLSISRIRFGHALGQMHSEEFFGL